MFKTRFISMLVLLCLTVSGAWAQTETLLTTIESEENESFTSGSQTFGNIATVTFSGEVINDGDNWGWYYNEERTLTVTAAEGYTITRVKFYNDEGSAFDEEAPFEAILATEYHDYITKVNGTSIGTYGVTKIEVYGYADTPEPATYTVTLKEGTEDATSWTIAPAEATTTGVAAGTTVTATYGGTKKVKSVKAKKKANIVNLSTLEGDYVAQNGDVLTGTLNGSEKPYKISIADGATVTLDNAIINGVSGSGYNPEGGYSVWYRWCGLTCEGDATIILKDGTTNAVKGFYKDYPGIYVPEGKTLTIKGGAAGTGKLTAQNGTEGHSSGTGAGIGAGYGLSCGHINIQGGEITATGQGDSAGIGGANSGNCGNITISGGKINATGDENSAGIGGSAFMSCGDITIESTVISVTATSGSSIACSIGKGYSGSCGTVTIGGTVYPNGTSSGTFTYPQP